MNGLTRGFWGMLLLSIGASTGLFAASPALPEPPNEAKVLVIPIREDIGTPLVYLVRRGVKEAIEANAVLLVLDMDTNGGRVDKTEEIIEIIEKFKGETVTFVNKRAFSAGAFISFGTRQIWMAPGSVIGAAAPISMAPGGGAQTLPDTVDAKITSAVAALVRAVAERNGHNVQVADAMVNKTRELTIDGVKLNEKGQILSLTSQEAEKKYGQPPKPLVSRGTVDSLDQLIQKLGYGSGTRIEIKPTGFEQLGTFLNSQTVSAILLVIGIAGFYIEFKTPGFGLPGIVGIIAFTLYFLGGYAAGLSGLGWIVLFFLGVALIVTEIFVFTGTMICGLTGVALILVSLVMAMVDTYPEPGRMIPTLPSGEALVKPIQIMLVAAILGTLVLGLLGRFLPSTPLFQRMVSHSTSGQGSDKNLENKRARFLGQEGVAISTLRPGGKAQFGDEILDVMGNGELIEKGQRLRIVAFSGQEAIVEKIATDV